MHKLLYIENEIKPNQRSAFSNNIWPLSQME